MMRVTLMMRMTDCDLMVKRMITMEDDCDNDQDDHDGNEHRYSGDADNDDEDGEMNLMY